MKRRKSIYDWFVWYCYLSDQIVISKKGSTIDGMPTYFYYNGDWLHWAKGIAKKRDFEIGMVLIDRLPENEF